MGADDLVANGHEVAIIDYHGGDDYENTYSIARLSYYGLGGYPTTWFDGGNPTVGGNSTQSMYTQFLPKVNQRLAIPSSFTIGIEGENYGMMDYEIHITVEKVAAAASSDLTLHVVLTETDIPDSWQNQTHVNFVERLMAPNHLGTPLDFSNGDIVEVDVSFSMDPSWVNENCEIVVFVQDVQSKEILQGTNRHLSLFPITSTHDAAVSSIEVPNTVCIDTFVPVIEIANYGLENLTSLDVVYFVNSEPQNTFNWTGDLALLESEIIELPELGFDILDNNTVTVQVSNPNGVPDQYTPNNEMVVEMDAAPNVSAPVSLALKLDDNPEEISWEVVGSDGTVFYSGGPYTQAGQYLIETFELTDPDCYSFNIYDSGGDGLTGLGWYKLVNSSNDVFAEGYDFGYSDKVQFGIGLVGITETSQEGFLSLFPNPASENVTLIFELGTVSEVTVSLFSTTGEMVYLNTLNGNTGTFRDVITNDDFQPGIYFLRVGYGDRSITRKLVFK